MARQGELPGTERKRIEEVETAAEAYVRVRDRRMKLSKSEKEAKDALIAVMRKHHLDVYKDTEATPPLVVRVSQTDNVKVEAVASDDDEDGE